MDINKLRPVRMSPCSREKVIYDFYADLADVDDIYAVEKKLDKKTAPLHAGALCLYATTLITKVFETNPQDLDPYYKERESSLKVLIKSNPKYTSFTDEQVSTFAHNLIIKDIRNSFAHGNFEISYDIYTKKLYFVLKPQRKDFVTPEPIVISKNALINANKKILNEIGKKYAFFSEQLLHNEITNHLDRALKSFILPTQMLQLANYYLDNSVIRQNDILFERKMYHLIQYALLASKITYEQDDYYSLFGKNSNVFDTISLVRNTLAHDNLKFVDNAENISYTDPNRTLTESVGKSASKLLIVDSQKQALMALKNNLEEDYDLQDIIGKFKDIFDFFFDGTYDFEDIVECITNNDKKDDDDDTNDKA